MEMLNVLGTQVAIGHSEEQTSLPTPAMSESSTMIAIPMIQMNNNMNDVQK